MRPSGFLKLCLVVAVISIGPIVAACTPDAQAVAATADTWAKRVCNLIEQTPPAAASTLPSNVTIDVQITPSVAVAVVASYPPPQSSVADAGPPQDAAPIAVSALKIPLPQGSEKAP